MASGVCVQMTDIKF